MKIALRRVSRPKSTIPVERPTIPVAEYEARSDVLYASAGLDWLAVYGDREHNANLLFLTNFDPRFEEGLLLLGPGGRRVLLVGNEGLTHVSEARLPADVHLYQPFSLMGQPREQSRPLADLLLEIGIEPGAQIGIAGWKYLADGEIRDPQAPSFVPAFLPAVFDRVAGTRSTDVTSLLMDPVHAIRNRNSAAQIAQFEWGAVRSGAAVMRMMQAIRPGMTEHGLVGAMEYAGEPLSCHVMTATGNAQLNGLRSATGRRIEKGDAITVGVGYWGGLTCRAGLVTDEPDDSFMRDFVEPYFRAIATWWSTLRIGVSGGEMEVSVMQAMEGASFRPALNPGHLGSFDEWVHSPISEGSTDPLTSGMVLQCDIIPAPLPDGRALNCEDTVALADAALREQIESEYPDLWRRILERRQFMREQLGIDLRPEVLPLSLAPTYLAPFWLDPQLVCTVSA